jgi:hypothetical protein
MPVATQSLKGAPQQHQHQHRKGCAAAVAAVSPRCVDGCAAANSEVSWQWLFAMISMRLLLWERGRPAVELEGVKSAFWNAVLRGHVYVWCQWGLRSGASTAGACTTQSVEGVGKEEVGV